MKKLITIVLVLGLFLGITGTSFAETLFGFSMGYYRFSDEYKDEDFGRVQNGVIFNFDFSYYFPVIPIGIYSKASIAGILNGYEWKDDDKIQNITDSNFMDIFFFIGPSIKLKLGKVVEIPISLGPSFRMSFEGFSEENNKKEKDDSYYEGINLGITGEVSILIYTADWSYIKLGICGSFDFYRQEQGEMNMEYRKKTITRFTEVEYNAIAVSAFIGFGFRFK